MRTALAICAVYIVVVGTVVYTLAPTFVHIFITEPAAVAFGVSMVHVMVPFYYFQVLNNVFANAVRGFGKSFVVMLCSILGMIGCRPLFLAIAMSINYRVENVYAAYPVGWACAGISCMIYYFIKIRPKYTKEMKEAQAAGSD